MEFMAEYRTASDEGRLHPEIAAELGLKTGRYKCELCGMRASDPQAAWDCCRKPDRVTARGFRSGGTAQTAMVVDRDALVAAMDALRAAGNPRTAQMFDGDTKDAFRAFRSRVKSGKTAVISAHYWRHLVKMFGPKVPGCVEVHDDE